VAGKREGAHALRPAGMPHAWPTGGTFDWHKARLYSHVNGNLQPKEVNPHSRFVP
jgi:hypothetical protein